VAEPKEWLSANIKPMNSTVTCSIQDGGLSAKATVKTYRSPVYVKAAAAEARKTARATLATLREFMEEVESDGGADD
jgi:hypothetical protein